MEIAQHVLILINVLSVIIQKDIILLKATLVASAIIP